MTQKTLGLTTLVLLVVASMIGIGCFFSSGFALLSLGNPGRVLLAWVLCGGWAMAGAVAYGALAKRVPLSGGEYLYLSRLMHPSIGFLAGWISLVAGFTAPIAAMAKAVVSYAAPTLGTSPLASALATSIILLACLLHAAKLELGARVQNAIVIIKLGFIALLITYAASLAGQSQTWPGGTLPNRSSDIWPSDWQGATQLLAAMSWLSLSYTGFNAAVYVAGESKSAKRNVPLAMWLAACLVTVLYVCLNAIFVYGAPTTAVTDNPAIIALSAAEHLGGVVATLMRVIVPLAVLSSVFGMLLAGPRVYHQMASDGVMPQFLHAKQGVPRLAIWFQGLLSIAIVWIAELEQLIGYLGMTLAACSTLAVSALWSRTPQHSDDHQVRWYEYLAGGIYCSVTIAMLLAVSFEGQRRHELWAMLLTFAVGLAIYLIWQKKFVPAASSP